METLILIFFMLIQLFFWLLAAYYTSVVIFSFLARQLHPLSFHVGDPHSRVAILYPTFNDFQPEAAASCLNQDYTNYHLFLIDDSTRIEFRNAIDAFHKAYPDKTTIVRRSTRKGFKPGALNYALSGVAANYPFFAVVDADERLPADFLQKSMSRMKEPKLAFVQANHAPNPHQSTPFASELSSSILSFWDVFCQVRNLYGFVIYLGHGAVIRRSAWTSVGGFPENILTEDLAFSVLLRLKGYQGIFIKDLLCYEDFPQTYSAFKRQHERFIVGTTQVIYHYFLSIIRSNNISWIEKMDFVFWCLPLYVPALLLVYIALCSIGLVLLFSDLKFINLYIFDYKLVLPYAVMLDERFDPIWSRDFQLLSIFVTFSPAFASLILGLKGRIRALELISLSTIPYHSLMVISWKALLNYLITGRFTWVPTGERFQGDFPNYNHPVRLPWRSASYFSTFWRKTGFWEILIGTTLALASLVSFNIAFFAVSCCLLMGAYIEKFGWDGKSTHLASRFCFLLIILPIFFTVTISIGSSGPIPLAFSVQL